MIKKIRLLQVIPNMGIGGAETGCRHVADYVAEHCDFSSVLTSGGSQINLFNGAAIIISPSGASLANLIYCNNKARIGVLSVDSKFTFLDLWTKLAAATSRARISILLCRGINKNNLHSDFNVSINDLADFIVKIEFNIHS